MKDCYYCVNSIFAVNFSLMLIMIKVAIITTFIVYHVKTLLDINKPSMLTHLVKHLP